jgi:hypothetical protein
MAIKLKHGNSFVPRSFATSMRAKYPKDKGASETASALDSNAGPTIRRTTNMSGAEPPAAGSWAYDANLRAFTEDKLYSTKNRPLIRKFTKNFDHPKRRDVDFDAPQSIEFEEEMGDEDTFSGNDEIYQLTDRRGERESTITPSERYAFQKIFSDIFQRYDRSKSESLVSSVREEFLADKDDAKQIPQGDLQQAESKLTDIFNGAISMSRDKKEEAVNRYPIALRPAAARAIGLDIEKEEERAIQEEENSMENERMEALREPERARVEGLMKAATSDFELWDIMEKEVFALISKMGLEEVTAVPDQTTPVKPTKRNKRSRKPEIEQDVKDVQKFIAPEASDSINGVSPLSLYGPLYPSYLLLGLRLLDRAFARPSPLALSLLPKIKSMGFISHVLGASTQFYNELIRIYRYRHDNFTGIIELLTEMETAALEMDEETFEVIFDITQTQLSVDRGDKGNGIRALWKMSEFAPRKFKPWKTRIEQAISERKLRANAHTDQYFV